MAIGQNFIIPSHRKILGAPLGKLVADKMVAANVLENMVYEQNSSGHNGLCMHKMVLNKMVADKMAQGPTDKMLRTKWYRFNFDDTQADRGWG